jgi:hypothetical protein
VKRGDTRDVLEYHGNGPTTKDEADMTRRHDRRGEGGDDIDRNDVDMIDSVGSGRMCMPSPLTESRSAPS